MAGKNPNYINFKLQLIIRDLKNFTNFIAELKQKGIKFKILDTKIKEMLSPKKYRYFKKTNALLEGHFILSSDFHQSIFNVQNF